MSHIEWRDGTGTPVTWGPWQQVSNVDTIDTTRFEVQKEIDLKRPASIVAEASSPADALITETISGVTKLDFVHVDDYTA